MKSTLELSLLRVGNELDVGEHFPEQKTGIPSVPSLSRILLW